MTASSSQPFQQRQQPAVDPRSMSIERPDSVTIATYDRYVQAQRMVDYLSDQGFAVEHVRIIGRGLHSVEQVITRMTKGKAALFGAASGMWIGLLIGLLLSFFTTGSNWGPILLGVALGALWGATLGFVGHAATRGQRDFASAQRLEADTYEVEVTKAHAEEAANIAGRLLIRDGQS